MPYRRQVHEWVVCQDELLEAPGVLEAEAVQPREGVVAEVENLQRQRVVVLGAVGA